MKANAPEKIYVKITHPISDEYTEMIAFENGDGIEYIMKDAFIEKACEYFAPHINDNSGGYDRAFVLDGFKKYIEE